MTDPLAERAHTMLARRADEVEPGPPPLDRLLVAGRRRERRRTRLVWGASAGAVTVVTTAAVAWVVADHDPGPAPSGAPATSTPSAVGREPATRAQLLGTTWVPVELFGDPVSQRWGLAGQLITLRFRTWPQGSRPLSWSASDGCNDWSAWFRYGEDGGYASQQVSTTDVGCVGPERDPLRTRAGRVPEAMSVGRELRNDDGVLVVLDADGVPVGRFMNVADDDAWAPLDAGALEGRWKPGLVLEPVFITRWVPSHVVTFRLSGTGLAFAWPDTCAGAPATARMRLLDGGRYTIRGEDPGPTRDCLPDPAATAMAAALEQGARLQLSDDAATLVVIGADGRLLGTIRRADAS